MAKKSSKQKFKQLVLDSCSFDPPLVKKKMHKSKMHSNLYHPPKKKDIKTFKTKSIEIMPFLGPHFTSCIPSSAPGATLKCFSELSIPKKPSRPTQSDSGPVFYLYIRPRHVEHAKPVLFLFVFGGDG